MKTSYETITKKVMKDIFSKLHELHNDLPFLPERMKIEKVKKLLAIMYMIKLIMLFLVGLSPSKQNYFYFLQ